MSSIRSVQRALDGECFSRRRASCERHRDVLPVNAQWKIDAQRLLWKARPIALEQLERRDCFLDRVCFAIGIIQEFGRRAFPKPTLIEIQKLAHDFRLLLRIKVAEPIEARCLYDERRITETKKMEIANYRFWKVVKGLKFYRASIEAVVVCFDATARRDVEDISSLEICVIEDYFARHFHLALGGFHRIELNVFPNKRNSGSIPLTSRKVRLVCFQHYVDTGFESARSQICAAYICLECEPFLALLISSQSQTTQIDAVLASRGRCVSASQSTAGEVQPNQFGTASSQFFNCFDLPAVSRRGSCQKLPIPRRLLGFQIFQLYVSDPALFLCRAKAQPSRDESKKESTRHNHLCNWMLFKLFHKGHNPLPSRLAGLRRIISRRRFDHVLRHRSIFKNAFEHISSQNQALRQ